MGRIQFSVEKIFDRLKVHGISVVSIYSIDGFVAYVHCRTMDFKDFILYLNHKKYPTKTTRTSIPLYETETEPENYMLDYFTGINEGSTNATYVSVNRTHFTYFADCDHYKRYSFSKLSNKSRKTNEFSGIEKEFQALQLKSVLSKNYITEEDLEISIPAPSSKKSKTIVPSDSPDQIVAEFGEDENVDDFDDILEKDEKNQKNQKDQKEDKKDSEDLSKAAENLDEAYTVLKNGNYGPTVMTAQSFEDSEKNEKNEKTDDNSDVEDNSENLENKEDENYSEEENYFEKDESDIYDFDQLDGAGSIASGASEGGHQIIYDLGNIYSCYSITEEFRVFNQLRAKVTKDLEFITANQTRFFDTKVEDLRTTTVRYCTEYCESLSVLLFEYEKTRRNGDIFDTYYEKARKIRMNNDSPEAIQFEQKMIMNKMDALNKSALIRDEVVSKLYTFQRQIALAKNV